MLGRHNTVKLTHTHTSSQAHKHPSGSVPDTCPSSDVTPIWLNKLTPRIPCYREFILSPKQTNSEVPCFWYPLGHSLLFHLQAMRAELHTVSVERSFFPPPPLVFLSYHMLSAVKVSCQEMRQKFFLSFYLSPSNSIFTNSSFKHSSRVARVGHKCTICKIIWNIPENWMLYIVFVLAKLNFITCIHNFILANNFYLAYKAIQFWSQILPMSLHSGVQTLIIKPVPSPSKISSQNSIFCTFALWTEKIRQSWIMWLAACIGAYVHVCMCAFFVLLIADNSMLLHPDIMPTDWTHHCRR